MPARLQLLGRFTLRAPDGTLVPISAARVQSLLAWTALHPGAHERGRVASILWADVSDSQARNNLRQLLHQLRRAWPSYAGSLEANDTVLGWRAPVQVDVSEFEHHFARAQDAWRRGDRVAAASALDAATALYDGPLIPTCADAWVEDRRARQARQGAEALDLVVRLHEERHELPQAIAAAMRLVALDPAEERSCLRLMRLHALAGDRPAALRAYDSCVRALREELDTGPSAELQEAAKRLSVPRRRHRPDGGAQSPLPLVGRDREWRELRRAWDDVQKGARLCVLISGEAGVGKSRLAEEMLTWAEAQGIAAARARVYEAEGRLALAPVAEWLRSAAVRPSLDGLDAATRVECSRLVPDLHDASPVAEPAPLSDYWHRQRFFDALARAVNAAAPTLLLVLDDLQWSDPDTLEWLHYLLRSDSPSVLLVVGTARDDETGADHPVTRFRTAARATNQLREIALASLDAAETGRLAASVAGTDVDTEAALRLYVETRGNPLFIVETMRAGGPAPQTGQLTSIPARVQAVIMGRLHQLSADARDLAGLAAAAGRAFDPELLVAASGLDEERATRAFDELWRRKIIREATADGSSFDLTHDRVRDVAYGMLGPAERRRWHLRLAAALESRFAASSDVVASQLAAHYDRAGQPARAVPYYEQAARVAQRLFAYEESRALLERLLDVLAHTPDNDHRARQELEARLMLAAAIRVLEGWASPRLEPVHARVMVLSEQVGTLEQRAIALLSAGFFGEVRAQLDRVGEHIAEMREAADRSGSPTLRVMAATAAAGHCIMTGRFGMGEAVYRDTASWYDPAQHPVHVRLTGADFGVLQRAWTSHGVWALGDARAALDRASEALALATGHGHPFSQALAYAYRSTLYQLEGDVESCAKDASAALETATRSRVSYYGAWAAILLAWKDSIATSTVEAAAIVLGRIDEFLATGAGSRHPYYLALAAEAHQRAGDGMTALSLLDRAIACAARQGDTWFDADLHRRRAETCALLGRAADADAAVQVAIDIATAQEAPSFLARALATRARLATNPSTPLY
jgi:DNA-binding SARP family transcriptional activator